MGEIFSDFAAWLYDLVVEVFGWVPELIEDVFIWTVELVLDAVGALLSAIPLPEFVQGGLQSLWASLDPGMMWILSQFGIPECLAMFGAAYLFVFVRKLATLFQW